MFQETRNKNIPKEIQLQHRESEERSRRIREQGSRLQDTKPVLQTKLQRQVQIQTQSRNLGRVQQEGINELMNRRVINIKRIMNYQVRVSDVKQLIFLDLESLSI